MFQQLASQTFNKLAGRAPCKLYVYLAVAIKVSKRSRLILSVLVSYNPFRNPPILYCSDCLINGTVSPVSQRLTAKFYIPVPPDLSQFQIQSSPGPR
jgi:hypothetical protein